MGYRSFADRRVSTYGALLIITVIGAISTLMIVRAAQNVVLTPETEGVLSTVDQVPVPGLN